MADLPALPERCDPERCDLLIEGGAIITMDEAHRVLENGAVAVHDGRIIAVGLRDELNGRFNPSKIIRAPRSAVLPGLIDAHSHAGISLLKGIGRQLPYTHRQTLAGFVNSRASAEWWQMDATLSALERLRSGTTTSLLMLGVKHTGSNPDVIRGVCRGYGDLGIRSILGIGPSSAAGSRELTTWKAGRRRERTVTIDEEFEASEEAVRTFNADDTALSKLCLACSTIKEALPFARRFASTMTEFNVDLHVHADAAEIAAADAGSELLGARTVIAHGRLDMRAVEILARTGTRVAHCPRSPDIALARERPLLTEMLDAGITVGLGSDGSGLDRPHGSMFEYVNLAPRWQWLGAHQFNLVPPGKALRMATIDAARAIGQEKRIGSIEIGKDADLIIVDLSGPHAAPFSMPVQRLTSVVRGSDVTSVVVAGRVLMEDRKITSIDEMTFLGIAQEEAEHIVDLFGLQRLIGRYDPGYEPQASSQAIDSPGVVAGP